jgi:RimJ/RimL family protein N-acetyltransferase
MILKRCTPEGVLREYEFTQGNFHDQVVLALLRSDWEN